MPSRDFNGFCYRARILPSFDIDRRKEGERGETEKREGRNKKGDRHKPFFKSGTPPNSMLVSVLIVKKISNFLQNSYPQTL